jgi:hypothetical protein
VCARCGYLIEACFGQLGAGRVQILFARKAVPHPRVRLPRATQITPG